MSQFSHGNRLMAEAAGFTPMAGGYPSGQFMDVSVPGIGPNNPLNLLLQPMLSSMMGSMGMAPMGLNDQNILDVMRRQQFNAMQQKMLQQAAQAEHGNFMRTARGMAMVMGVPFGQDQYAAANVMANFGVQMAPMVATLAPDFLDQFGGHRGSPTVLAAQLMMANRYRSDPVTGQLGFSVDSNTALQKEIFDKMAGSSGFRAGQLGQLYGALSQRGMIAGVSNDQMDRLNVDEGTAGRMRAMDSGKIRRSLESYIDAVSAVRDIFGDMGQPHAPMQELMNSLERLTQGSVQKLNTAQIGSMVRMTHEIAQRSGMSIDAAMVLQQHAAARAGAMGLDPVFGVNAAQGSMAFGLAYRDMGMNAPEFNRWGRMRADQVMQLDANLRVNAAASPLANRMGLALRLADTVGLTPGTDAANYAEALRNGASEFTDSKGNRRSVGMGSSEFLAMFNDPALSSRGLTAATVQTMIGQGFTNQEYIQKYNLDAAARSQQPAEIRRQLENRMRGTLIASLRNAGVDGATAVEIANKKAASIVAGINGQTTGEGIGWLISSALQDTGVAKQLTARGTELGEFGQLAGENFYGSVDKWVRGTPGMQQYESGQGLFQAQDPKIHARTQHELRVAGYNARFRQATQKLGRGTFLSRGMEALMEADAIGDNNNVMRILAKAAGGVPIESIEGALADPMRDVTTKAKAMQATAKELSNPNLSAEAKKSLEAQLRSQEKDLETSVKGVVETAGKHGIYLNDHLTGEQVKEARGSAEQEARLRTEVGDMRREEHDATRGRAFNGYWGSEQGATFANAARRAQSRASVTSLAMLGDKMGEKYGTKGIGAAISARKSIAGLQSLALAYTDGNIERLIAGDIRGVSAEERAAVNAQVGELKNQRDKDISTIGGMIGKTKPSDITAEDKDMAEKMRTAELKKGSRDNKALAEDLLKVFGLEGEADKKLLENLNSPHGRSLAETLIEQRTLKEKGDKNAEMLINRLGFDRDKVSDLGEFSEQFGKRVEQAGRADKAAADESRAQPVKLVGPLTLKGKLDLSGEIDAQASADGLNHEKSEVV